MNDLKNYNSRNFACEMLRFCWPGVAIQRKSLKTFLLQS